MTDDAALAAEIATAAGELLLTVRAAEADTLSGRELGRRGDHDANMLILEMLAEHRPGDAVLSEESADDPARVDAERVWIIDPLDGSKEYGMLGHTDWAVHVALWEAGRGLTAGAVAGTRRRVQHRRGARRRTASARRGSSPHRGQR